MQSLAKYLVIVVVFLSMAGLAGGCGEDTTYAPITTCRCKVDEMCIERRCVPSTGQILVMPGAAPEVSCVPSPAMINEVALTRDDQGAFVELRGSAGADLTGYLLRVADAQERRIFSATLVGRVDAQGLWLAGLSAEMGAISDLNVWLDGVGEGGSMELLDCQGLAQDYLRFGRVTGDPLPAPLPVDGFSVGRCPSAAIGAAAVYQDDFLLGQPSPRAENGDSGQRAQCQDCHSEGLGTVFIDEVFCGSEQDGPFVEVYAPAGTLANLWLEVWDEGLVGWLPLAALDGEVDAAQRLVVTLNAGEIACSGGAVRLVGCGGLLFDTLAWGALQQASLLGLESGELGPVPAAGQALVRCANDEGRWIEVVAPSPGAAHVCHDET